MSMDLEELMRKVADVRIGVLGDFCLDVYWELDNSRSELSVETGLRTRTVKTQRYSLGGAGNVAANVQALGVRQVAVFGVAGDDPFGRQMAQLMREQSMQVFLVTQTEYWATHAYIKPIEDGAEASRIDFGNFNRLLDVTALRVVDELRAALPNLDAVIINQQVKEGIHSLPLFREALQQVIDEHSEKLFFLDSRDCSRCYDGTIRKLNAFEAALLRGREADARSVIDEAVSREDALALSREWRQPLVLSRGALGSLVVDGGQVHSIPAVKVSGPVDTVGAGDSMVAGVASAFASGATLCEATAFGSLVAAVTVQKLFQTGTATPGEIRRLAAAGGCATLGDGHLL